MNLQMSLQNKDYWTPSLAVVEYLHDSTHEVCQNIFLWKVYFISGDFFGGF